jgi:hypothetical protein
MFNVDISNKSPRFQKALKFFRYADTNSLYLAFDLFNEYKEIVRESDVKQSEFVVMMEFAAMMYVLGHSEGVQSERRKKRQ